MSMKSRRLPNSNHECAEELSSELASHQFRNDLNRSADRNQTFRTTLPNRRYPVSVKQSNAELVHQIFQACAELSNRSGRSISPDGHLVGSLGELHAANTLGLRLETASNAGFDAVDDQGRKVEIKTTTRSSISLSASGTQAERLVVVKLDSVTGVAKIVYDGDAGVAWDRAGKPGKNGQRILSISKLAT